MAVQTRVARTSSILLRLCSYFFLRWALIPILPAVVFALFAVNVVSFIASHLVESEYEVIGEEVDVVVTDEILTNGNNTDVNEEDAEGKDAQNEGAAEKRAENEDGENNQIAKEEVDITDTVILKRKALQPLQTLLLGAPSPSKLLSLLAVLTNACLVALVADRLYTEHVITADDLSFVRLGYVSDRDAKFLIREPDQAKMPVTVEIRLKDAEPPFDHPVWQTAGGVRWTDNSTDFTSVVPVSLPHPQHQRAYEWRTSNNHSGVFTAGPKPGAAPDLFGGDFTFVTTSCMVSRLPYNPRDHPLALPGVRHLARVLPGLGAQFMLFLGDFVYVDVPRWWGRSVQNYRQKYRQVYASPDWPPVAQNLSWLHVLDDHELANDWSSQQTGIYHTAVDPWHHYHAAANPPPPPASRQLGLSVHGIDAAHKKDAATYFAFTQGPASFFMLDTRSFRSSNRLPFRTHNKTMLGAAQLADLLAFLQRPEPRGVRWKIVASSVPFTKNWRINTRDTWGGFLTERQTVLEAMWEAGLHGTGVVVLSGDRHEFAATRFPPPANSTRWPASVAVHEFSASPLSQFYSPIPTYLQRDDADVKIAYIHTGNSKFGAVTIRNADESEHGESSLKYRLFVDGEQAWNTTLLAPNAPTRESVKASSIWNKILGYY
ncbi:alkaline phosphatase family protein [Niveomyces insectorum RCEF 264]|uniref:Alkaline phosphatase family protein n=1 Tax=Niveomyces insectorum RCEF 264 TaxID=1081102 RepID=A0A168AI97_9HYPO|nr:alkaline phosphatase family protein [Niveomyces insectorum RCEF 264]